MTEHSIRAAHDASGVFVYQAYSRSIAQAALSDGTLGGGGFSMQRMTWIKPSFGWMLYRAGYAAKPGQEVILRIRLSHEGFRQAIAWAVESSWNPAHYRDEATWREALQASIVRVQWDPDRDLAGTRLARRAIQLGLRDAAVQAYVSEWITGIEDVTALARDIAHAVEQGQPLPPVPEERLYPLPPSQPETRIAEE